MDIAYLHVSKIQWYRAWSDWAALPPLAPSSWDLPAPETSFRSLTPPETPFLPPPPSPSSTLKPHSCVGSSSAPIYTGLHSSSLAGPKSCTNVREVVFVSRNFTQGTTIPLGHLFTLVLGSLCPEDTLRSSTVAQMSTGLPQPCPCLQCRGRCCEPYMAMTPHRRNPFSSPQHLWLPPHLIYIFFPAHVYFPARFLLRFSFPAPRRWAHAFLNYQPKKERGRKQSYGNRWSHACTRPHYSLCSQSRDADIAAPQTWQGTPAPQPTAEVLVPREDAPPTCRERGACLSLWLFPLVPSPPLLSIPLPFCPPPAIPMDLWLIHSTPLSQ